MMRLSKRERFLIYLLAFIAVLAMGVLLVRPALAHYQDKLLELDDVRAQQDALDQEIARIPALQEQVATATAREAQLAAEFSGELVNESLDQLLTGMLRQHGLTPDSLTMSDVAPVELTAFGQEESSGLALLANSVTMAAYGEEARILALVDQIKANSYLYLDSCQIVRLDPASPDLCQLTATVSIYFAQTAQLEEE